MFLRRFFCDHQIFLRIGGVKRGEVCSFQSVYVRLWFGCLRWFGVDVVRGGVRRISFYGASYLEMLVLLKIFDWFLTRKKKTNSLSFMYRVVVNGTCNMYGKDPKADPLWVEVQVSSFLARENVASDALFISDLNAWVERYSERVAAFSRWQLLIYVVAVTPSSVAGLLAEDVVDLQAHTQLLNAIFGVYFRELSFYTRNVTSLGWFIQQAWLGFVVVYLKLRGWFWPLN